ncbi:MAG: ABC transporter permease [Planctomycetes bacterium]|nr:ABC transporter permease [Planctomycetota bacterium]
MLLGAVFEREVTVAPRARGLFVARAVYCGALLAIIATCWLVVTGTQSVSTAGDTARFGATLLRILGPLQLALAILAAALAAAVAVSTEKDRRTLELLLVSRLTDRELVLGKLAGSLVRVVLLLLAAVPMFAITSLFGGVTMPQLVRLFVVTLAAALTAASIATTVAFWKDTTFQTLSITLFLLATWTALGETLAATRGPDAGAAVSPARAVFAALAPDGGRTLAPFLGICAAIVIGANAVAVACLRRWNVAREQRLPATAEREAAAFRPARRVWRNPILWRETCTRAYGRMLILVRLAWLALFAVAVAGILREAGSPRPDRLAVAIAVIPMALASLVAVAALAVTSITTERDRGALDLLLVSDLEPKEFVWGKLIGVLVVAREMVLLPLATCAVMAVTGITTAEHALYLAAGMAALVFFVAVLGFHVGLSYTSSRQAIAVALGTVAFLFIGVATAMRIMVAFDTSFELQLAPFLAVIVGGAVGLYAALSARNPSAAIAWASALLPALTFVAITGFLQGNSLQVLLVVLVAYGFATTALLVPAIGAFDLLTGRKSAGD